jgi:hypothetical protein
MKLRLSVVSKGTAGEVMMGSWVLTRKERELDKVWDGKSIPATLDVDDSLSDCIVLVLALVCCLGFTLPRTKLSIIELRKARLIRLARVACLQDGRSDTLRGCH